MPSPWSVFQSSLSQQCPDGTWSVQTAPRLWLFSVEANTWKRRLQCSCFSTLMKVRVASASKKFINDKTDYLISLCNACSSGKFFMGNNIIPWNTFWLVWKRLEKMLSCQKLNRCCPLWRGRTSHCLRSRWDWEISQIYTALLSVSHFHEEQSHLMTEALCASEINLQLHSSHSPLVFRSLESAYKICTNRSPLPDRAGSVCSSIIRK